MSNDSPTPAMTGARIEGLDQALDRARKDGEAAATAAAQTQIIEAYAKGREDATAIMSSEAASGRTGAALSFARNPKFSVEEATGMLSSFAQESGAGATFQQKLKANDPEVPANAPNAGGQLTTVVNDFQANVAAHVSALLAAKR